MCVGGSPSIPTPAPTPAPNAGALRNAGRVERMRRARAQGPAADILTTSLSGGGGGAVKTLMGQ